MSTTRVLSRIPFLPLGLALSLFLVITYLLCVLYGITINDSGIHTTLLPMLLPGFTWLNLGGFLHGLLWSFAHGWYIAIVFTPLYNVFVKLTQVPGGR